MIQRLDQYGFAIAPKSEQKAVKELYKQVESEQGLVFHDYFFVDRVVNTDFNPEAGWSEDNEYYRKLDHSLRNIRIGMMAKEEYDQFYAVKGRKAREETIWGEEADSFNSNMAYGQGETGVSAEGPSETELALATGLYDEWQEKMRSFGRKGIFVSFLDGAISLIPKKSATGPLTVTVSSADGLVFEQTFVDGFKAPIIVDDTNS